VADKPDFLRSRSAGHGLNSTKLTTDKQLDPRFLMFTRFLATVSIGAVTIRPVFATFTAVLFVTMFWFAIHFAIWTMITVWLVMTIRLVSLMQW
jgi:hypothetical protein